MNACQCAVSCSAHMETWLPSSAEPEHTHTALVHLKVAAAKEKLPECKMDSAGG